MSTPFDFTSSATSKSLWRIEMRARLAALNVASREASAAAVGERVLSLLAARGLLRSGARVGGYLATPRELNIDALLKKLQQHGVRVWAPRETSTLCDDAAPFGEVAADWSNVISGKGNLQLRVPRAAAHCERGTARDLDAVLVPGLAFDESGSRLGQGGGWYDRVLAAAPGICKIGLGFDFQIVALLPVQPHDVRMNAVITPARSLTFDDKENVEHT